MSLKIGNQAIPTLNIHLSNSGAARYQEKNITPSTNTQNIIADAGYDALSKVIVNAISTQTKNITSNGTYSPTAGSYFSTITVNVPTGSTINNQDKTIIPSTSQQTITADSSYTGLGTVTVEAMPAMTLPTSATNTAASGYTSRATISRSTSDQYINIPTGYNNMGGYYKINATPNGGVNNPIATKGTVNNNSISITPSVTSSTGYITGGTKTGTVITVSASELVSGTLSVTTNGTKDVTNYASIDVAVPVGSTINNQDKTVTPTISKQTITADSGYTGLGTVTVNAMPTMTLPTAATASATSGFSSKATIGRSTADQYINIPTGYNSAGGYYKISAVANGSINNPTASKGTVSNHSISVTPSVTSTTGYITGGTKSGTAVSVSASELVSGTLNITSNGTKDVINYASVSVNIPSDINNQDKTVEPTESTQDITADSGYSGLGLVTVSAIPDTYIGSVVKRNSSTNLTVSGATVTVPAGYYENDASKSVATMTLPTSAASSATSGYTNKATIGRSTSAQYINIPSGYNSAGGYYTISAVANGTAGTPTASKGTVSDHTISITPSVTNTTGYITGSTKTGTAVTVSASELVSGTLSVTSNGTKDVTNYASINVNIPTGATINNQSKSVTPTKSQQIIEPDSGYTGLDSVTVAAIPAQYITTTDATATATQILSTKTAYVNGSKITGTMANNGAIGGTISTQGGTYTIPAGYTSGGTVTASLPTGSTTASNISGTSFEEDTGDYGFRASVQIQPGYYASATTISKDFSSILPAPETEGTAAQVLAGYDLYNHDGQLISGAMPNNSIGTITLDQTTTSYTIPSGYHNGTGKVQHATVNIPDPTITIDANGLITANGSWTRGFTTDNSYSNTKQLTARTSSSLTVSGGTVTAPAGYYAADASKAVATLTLPTTTASSATSGYTSKATINPSTSDQYINIGTGYNGTTSYYKINKMTTMTLPTSAATSATSGYTSKATINRSTSAQYINIPPGYNSSGAYYTISATPNGSATGPTSLTGSSATISTGTNTLTLTKTGVTTTPTVSAGYVASATASTATVTLTASVTTKAAATITPGTSNQTIASGTYLTGTQTIAGDADLVAANIKTGVQIFGVNGSFTSDATATAADIASGKSAYVNGSKINGELEFINIYVNSFAPSSSLGNDGDIYIQE